MLQAQSVPDVVTAATTFALRSVARRYSSSPRRSPSLMSTWVGWWPKLRLS